MKIGYARVSTADQSLDRQLDNLKAAGCEKIYQEKMTGTKAQRPELERMLDALREGDTLVIDSFSRLSRSTKDLLEMVWSTQNRRLHVRFVIHILSTRTKEVNPRIFTFI